MTGSNRARGPRLALMVLAACSVGAGEIGPGAYCALPEKGEVPKCLTPAQETYTEFFTGLDAGEPGDDAVAQVEAEVARGAEGSEAYLALSSLAYGYWRLAGRAAEAEGANPKLASRLERWNRLLAQAYETSPDDPRYRAAVREAAVDLNERVEFTLTCRDDQGEPAACNSTESVVRAINATGDEVGLRGAISQLLGRLFGGSE